MVYQIKYTENAAKTMRKMEKNAAKRILAKIEDLAVSPYEMASVTALSGDLKGLYRLRVGDYRVIYQIKDAELTILVLEMGDRKDIYR